MRRSGWFGVGNCGFSGRGGGDVCRLVGVLLEQVWLGKVVWIGYFGDESRKGEGGMVIEGRMVGGSQSLLYAVVPFRLREK